MCECPCNLVERRGRAIVLRATAGARMVDCLRTWEGTKQGSAEQVAAADVLQVAQWEYEEARETEMAFGQFKETR